MRRILFLMILVMLVATVAEAQTRRTRAFDWQRTDRWEISLSTRYTTSKDFAGDGGSSMSLDDDLGWGFGFAYNFNQHFNLGLLFGWRSIDYSATAIPEDPTEDIIDYKGTLTTSNFGILGEYNVLKGKITPYVSGGLAWMHINSNILAGYSSGCWYDPLWGYICGTYPVTYGTNTTIYSLGIGGRFDVNESFFIKAGYEHGWLDLDSYDSTDILRIDIGLLL